MSTTTTDNNDSVNHENDNNKFPSSILKGLYRSLGMLADTKNTGITKDMLYNEICNTTTSTNNTTTSTSIVVVGAGGIGCEIIKNLIWCGFCIHTTKKIFIFDLDTIDISNLNRQLLFRSHHVSQPKCTVACIVASEIINNSIVLTTHYNNNKTQNNNSSSNKETNTIETKIQLIPYHGNICDNNILNINFLLNNNVTIVINALDNINARRRVNRLCVATNIPLLDSGTTGYLGQVRTIHKNSNVSCYECTTQEPPKVYPICTIRSTPTSSVHTIVWAKELYKLLFNSIISSSMLYESNSIDNNTNEIENENNDNNDNNAETEATGTSSSTYMDSIVEYRTLLENCTSTGNRTSSNTAITIQHVQSIIIKILINLYTDEINKQLNMDRYKSSISKPIPLNILQLINIDSIVVSTTGSANDSIIPSLSPTQRSTYKQTDILSISDCVIEFIHCLQDVYNMRLYHNSNNKKDTTVVLENFDKDDSICMRFVLVASNLRNIIFQIQSSSQSSSNSSSNMILSYYTAKGIAGNIIPAIASTNAIAAGIQILQALQIIKAKLVFQQQAKKEEEQDNQNKLGTTTTTSTIIKTSDITNLKDYCSYVNIHRHITRNGLLISTSTLEEPNNNCFVCKNAIVTIEVICITNWTLIDFITKIIKQYLHFHEPTISIDGNIIWEEGDDADIDSYNTINCNKILNTLPNGGITHGTIIMIEDFSQDLTIELSIIEKNYNSDNNNNSNNNQQQAAVAQQEKDDDDEEDNDDPHKFRIVGKNQPIQPVSSPQPTAASSTVKTDSTSATTTPTSTKQHEEAEEDDDDDDIEIIDGNVDIITDDAAAIGKATTTTTTDQHHHPVPTTTKKNSAEEEDDDVILLIDSDDDDDDDNIVENDDDDDTAIKKRSADNDTVDDDDTITNKRRKPN